MNIQDLYDYICKVEKNNEFIFSLSEERCVLLDSYKKHPLDRTERYLNIDKISLEILLKELENKKYLTIDKIESYPKKDKEYSNYYCHLIQKGIEAKICGIEEYEKKLTETKIQKESKHWHEQTSILYVILGSIYVTMGLFRSNPHAILILSIILILSLLLNAFLLIKLINKKK